MYIECGGKYFAVQAASPPKTEAALTGKIQRQGLVPINGQQRQGPQVLPVFRGESLTMQKNHLQPGKGRESRTSFKNAFLSSSASFAY